MLVHGDLHQHNVLAASNDSWLALDPKGVAGEPEFDVLPALHNLWDDLVATGNTRRALLRRVAIIVEAGDLDGERARRWSQARAVDNLLGAVEDDDSDFAEMSHHIASWLT
ncbi:aminoglycoside phosphotransferase family protein [Fodinicola feengrottensis]|uniref:aminoglycoside phosphotransferase family protein n=1 Tax=Fodinicola feengrottensis TaxID=435914 RepID=UPI0024411E6D|nr:aminoglycoside phosphotransferase family protein [Fodinicola feengrottensis]